LHDSIIASCQRAGFSPALGQDAPQISSIVHLGAAGFGVSIVPQSIEQIHAKGIAYLPIEGDAPCAPIGLRTGRRAPMAVRNFVALARRSAHL
jgi:DNA-binding transcriptional LysR family regulator